MSNKYEKEYNTSIYNLSLLYISPDTDITHYKNKYLSEYNCFSDKKIELILNTLIYLRVDYENSVKYNPKLLLKNYYNMCLKLETLFKKIKTEEEIKNCMLKCNYCKQEYIKYTIDKCARCKSVYYCNYVCQRRDWDKKDNTSHKKLCPILKQKYDDTHFNTSIVADVSSDSYDISSDSSDMNSDTNLELNLDDTSDNNGINTTFQSSLSPYNS